MALTRVSLTADCLLCWWSKNWSRVYFLSQRRSVWIGGLGFAVWQKEQTDLYPNVPGLWDLLPEDVIWQQSEYLHFLGALRIDCIPWNKPSTHAMDHPLFSLFWSPPTLEWDTRLVTNFVCLLFGAGQGSYSQFIWAFLLKTANCCWKHSWWEWSFQGEKKNKDWP